MRETLTWPDWALDLLESYYALEGGANVRARLARRGLEVSEYSIRHKASRLDLGADMDEFMSVSEVRREAGGSAQAVLAWLVRRKYRRHCRTRGREVLVPLPAVRLYLHGRRVGARPRGRWSSARAAEAAGVSVPTLLRRVPHTLHGHTAYFRPEDVLTYAAQRQTPPPNHVPLRALTGPGGPRQTAQRWLTKNGTPARTYQPGPRAPLYVHADHARAFLTARGHREEQVETLLRRALQVDAMKLSESDREE